MRLDAVKAEADRKAQQKTNTEQGLPAFYESQPLTGHVDGDQVYLDNEHDSSNQSRIAGQGHSGYVQGSPGGRAIDDYYAWPSQTSGSNIYPPSRREPSAYAPSTYSASATQSPVPQHSLPRQASYGASPYEYSNPAALAVPGQYAQDPYAPQGEYGHNFGGSSCESGVYNPLS